MTRQGHDASLRGHIPNLDAVVMPCAGNDVGGHLTHRAHLATVAHQLRDACSGGEVPNLNRAVVTAGGDQPGAQLANRPQLLFSAEVSPHVSEQKHVQPANPVRTSVPYLHESPARLAVEESSIKNTYSTSR